MNTISIFIITYNEEIHIERCINCCKLITDKIYVIDSYSTDRTIEIAENLGAIVLKNKFINHAKQFNWGLSTINTQSDWIMRIDADETISTELAAEIIKETNQAEKNISAFSIKRRHIFMNKWIKHGGRYPLIMTRIWRNGHGQVEERWMDEHVEISEGKIKTLKNDFADHNLNNISYLIEKHNGYATREAVEIILEKINFRKDESSAKIPSQAKIKRFLKLKIYNRLPFWVSSTTYYIFRMIIQLGILDGKEGVIYHTIQGFFYRFTVGAKVEEFLAELNPGMSNNEIINKLSKITGLKLS